jgi:hypothetical protein
MGLCIVVPTIWSIQQQFNRHDGLEGRIHRWTKGYGLNASSHAPYSTYISARNRQ